MNLEIIIQMKENKSGSSEDVKSQVELFHEQKQLYQKHTVAITNKETLLESLHQSYLSHNSIKMGKMKTTINKATNFLQSLWNQIMPTFIKGTKAIHIKENKQPFYQILKKEARIITQGSLYHSLETCRRNKEIFIIAVYNQQQSLFQLPIYIDRKIKNFLILPLKNTRKKELDLLSITTKQQSKVTLNVCKFNFAGELIIFSEIDGGANDNDFIHYFAMTQFSINEYNEFQQSSLNRFKQGQLNNQ